MSIANMTYYQKVVARGALAEALAVSLLLWFRINYYYAHVNF